MDIGRNITHPAGWKYSLKEHTSGIWCPSLYVLLQGSFMSKIINIPVSSWKDREEWAEMWHTRLVVCEPSRTRIQANCEGSQRAKPKQEWHSEMTAWCHTWERKIKHANKSLVQKGGWGLRLIINRIWSNNFMLLIHLSCTNSSIMHISQEIMTVFFSFPEKTSNASLCLVIKDPEKQERESLGYKMLKHWLWEKVVLAYPRYKQVWEGWLDSNLQMDCSKGYLREDRDKPVSSYPEKIKQNYINLQQRFNLCVGKSPTFLIGVLK